MSVAQDASLAAVSGNWRAFRRHPQLAGAPYAFRAALLLIARNWVIGSVTFVMPSGHEISIRGVEPGPDARLIIHDFRFIRREAGENKPGKLLLLGLDGTVGEGLGSEKKLFEIGFLPRKRKARCMDGRAFGAPLGADLADKGRDRPGPSDHFAFMEAVLETATHLAA